MNKKSEGVMKYIRYQIFPTKWFPIDFKFFVHSPWYSRKVGQYCEANILILTCCQVESSVTFGDILSLTPPASQKDDRDDDDDPED